jgi:hypothetical protein
VVPGQSKANDQQPLRLRSFFTESKLCSFTQKKPNSVVKKYLQQGYPSEAAHTKAAKIADGVARMN